MTDRFGWHVTVARAPETSQMDRSGSRSPAPCHGPTHSSARESAGTEIEGSEFAFFP